MGKEKSFVVSIKGISSILLLILFFFFSILSGLILFPQELINGVGLKELQLPHWTVWIIVLCFIWLTFFYLLYCLWIDEFSKK